jgi:hypothetical protein
MVGRCKPAWQKNRHVRPHVVMWHEVNEATEVSFEDGTKEVVATNQLTPMLPPSFLTKSVLSDQGSDFSHF